LARGRELGHHDLVHQRDVRLHVEDVAGQLDRAGLVALGVDHVDRAHLAPPFLAAERTRISAPLGPGTAPLTSSRLFSVSTACTVRFCTVKRWLPMRPAIRTPLKTRPGVAQAPMEPGERCLRSTPWLARRPWNPWRFMTPAKPLPLVLPLTSMRSPGANVSAVTSWPSSYSLASV